MEGITKNIKNQLMSPITYWNFDQSKFNVSKLPTTNETGIDTASFFEMSESMVIKQYFNSNCFIYEGDINNNNSCFKVAYDGKIDYDCEGKIGNKYIVLHRKGDKITGRFQNKEINLNIDIQKEHRENYFNHKITSYTNFVSLSGTIDGKPYSIKMPDVAIPKDADEKDILTSILVLADLKPYTIDGKIVRVLDSDNKRLVIDNINEGWDTFINNNITQNIKPIIQSTVIPAILGFLLGNKVKKG